MKIYLLAYNLVSFFAWAYVLYSLVFDPATNEFVWDPKTAFARTGYLVALVQTGAVLEVN